MKTSDFKGCGALIGVRYFLANSRGKILSQVQVTCGDGLDYGSPLFCWRCSTLYEEQKPGRGTQTGLKNNGEE